MTAQRFEEVTKRVVGSQHSRRRLLHGAGGALAAAAVAGPRLAGSQTATPAPMDTNDGDVAGLVDLGGRSFYLESHGAGGPTVVFESGFRDSGASWSTDLPTEPGATPVTTRTMVLPGVAAFTRVVAYDRPGTALDLDHLSRSNPVPMPRAATDVVNDLHGLLVAAEIPGPYVLVGHSLGGLFVRLYASTYPEEVAGLVLVDAWSEGLRDALTPEGWRTYVDFGLAVSEVPPGVPALETYDFDAVADAMTRALDDHPLREIPLFVITAGRPFDISEADLGVSPDAWQGAWATAQAQLAMLLPDAGHVIAEESGHIVHLQQPELVIEAIRQAIGAVRDPDTWATPTAIGKDASGIHAGRVGS